MEVLTGPEDADLRFTQGTYLFFFLLIYKKLEGGVHEASDPKVIKFYFSVSQIIDKVTLTSLLFLFAAV